MPPRRELNDRFKTHIQRARTARALSISTLSVGLIIGAGVAFVRFAPLSEQTQAIAETASAAASSLFDDVGAFIGNIFRPNTLATANTPSENWSSQPQVRTAAASAEPTTDTATSSEPSTVQSKALTQSPASSDDATASSLAVSIVPSSHPGRVLGASREVHIVEHIYDPLPIIPSITSADLTALESRVNRRIDNILSPPPFPQNIGGNGSGITYSAPPAAQRIDRKRGFGTAVVTTSRRARLA